MDDGMRTPYPDANAIFPRHDLGAQGYMVLTMCRARARAVLIERAIGWQRDGALGACVADNPAVILLEVLNVVRRSICAVFREEN
jgi:hypothetical protein